MKKGWQIRQPGQVRRRNGSNLLCVSFRWEVSVSVDNCASWTELTATFSSYSPLRLISRKLNEKKKISRVFCDNYPLKYIYTRTHLHILTCSFTLTNKYIYTYTHYTKKQTREMLCISNKTQYSSASLIGHLLGFQLVSYRRKYISRKIFSSRLNPSDDWSKIYLIHLFILNIYI